MNPLTDSELFRVVDNSAKTPVILHAPHGGRRIPAEHLGSYIITLAELEAEKDLMTDHYTDDLVTDIDGASAIINELSRFAVDVERFPNDTEEMNEVGMGVLYTHGSQRQELRRLTEAEKEPLLDYFDAYSARLTQLVDDTLAAHGRAVIVDVHSYPQVRLAYELHGDVYRGRLCIGSDPFHASDAFLATVAECFPDLESIANEPFAGAYVPLKHYRRDSRVSSVMLEIRRDVYMDETTLELHRPNFQSLRDSLQHLVCRLGKESDR